MPTPVTAARQCLTEEAARALDEAVAVAKRRSHAQTTSLHAISALLSPSFSLLRDALSRARSSAYSPRLQLRALELCVGVSLDRLPSAKNENDDFAPPISNSLMAALKRSQANQRRQPDMYHLHHISISHHPDNNNNNSNNNNNNSPLSISSIKVELKHFVLSILDDPIISRVFGEAGFRSSDIKLAIIHPPRWTPSGVTSATTRCPPLFLCNFTDFTASSGGSIGGDENNKRIIEIMKKEKERNPMLVGVCAKDALASFKEEVLSNKRESLVKKVVCLEKEIKECDKEGLDKKLNEAKSTAESVGDGGGIVISVGELKYLVANEGDYGEGLVKKVMKLNEEGGKRMWIIGAASNYETYSEFVGKFENVEKYWDLHPLPITSSSFPPKSSFMGSFVPFGGFFPTPSEFRPSLPALKQPLPRCNACNENCEREIAMLREESSTSVAGEHSSSLPSWFQRTDSDTCKSGSLVTQVKDVSKEKISYIQKKWDDHCRLVHQSPAITGPPVSLARLRVPQPLGFQFMADMHGSHTRSGDSSITERAYSSSSCGMQIVARNISPQGQVSKVDLPQRALQISECHPSPRGSSVSLTYPVPRRGLPSAHELPESVSVTTDLGLGTIYASKDNDLKMPFLQDRQVHLQHFSSPFPTNPYNTVKKDSAEVVHSSCPLSPNVIEGSDSGDYKLLFRKLYEAVSWQGEAISRIAQVVACCKSRNSHQLAKTRGNIWLSFLGPDRIGKKRVAQALADAVSGSRDRLIAMNLSSQDMSSKTNSLFLGQGSHGFDINASRVTVVDHVAQELSKKPQSVLFLENIEEADPLMQDSLSHAIQTGKFRDSRGREVGINNVVFVTTSSVTKDEISLSPRKEFIKFPEEKILEAESWQMQLAVREVSGDTYKSNETKVSILSPKRASYLKSSTKRKLSDIRDTSEQLAKRVNKMPESSLDLNKPLEDVEEDVEKDSCGSDCFSDGSKAWLEGFFDQVDGNVAFKPFDFDALADSLLRKMRLKLKETSREERILLEIDYEVMVQILAAAWLSDKRGAVEDWTEHVLGTNFAEVRERYNLTSESVVRLCSCEGVPIKEWASGLCLPSRINLSI